ncbi:MAG: sigma-70 family RNA polymerase sigma factor [Pirellulaceae bacterium]
MTANPPDSDELSRLASGWLEQWGDALFQYAMNAVRKRDVAEDLLQETLLAAIRSHDRFQQASSVKTWLFSILRHKIYDYFRSKQRKDRRTDSSAEVDKLTTFDKHGHWIEAVGRWPNRPEQSLEKSEFWQIFDRCCEKLNESLAVPFRLREVEQMEFEEICEMLQLTATNLSVRLHRARLGLRKCLEENWFVP